MKRLRSIARAIVEEILFALGLCLVLALFALAGCSGSNFEPALACGADECAEETGAMAETSEAEAEPLADAPTVDAAEVIVEERDGDAGADAEALPDTFVVPDTPDTADAFVLDTAVPDTKDAGADVPADGCTTPAGATAEYVWARWPIPADSPGAANYTAGTICGSKVVTDKTTGLIWAADEEPGKYTWSAAKARCAARGTGWRLPTRIELVSLIDYGRASAPTINITAFPAATIGYLWSSSPSVSILGMAWSVAFTGGTTSYHGVGDSYAVRCVR